MADSGQTDSQAFSLLLQEMPRIAEAVKAFPEAVQAQAFETLMNELRGGEGSPDRTASISLRAGRRGASTTGEGQALSRWRGQTGELRLVYPGVPGWALARCIARIGDLVGAASNNFFRLLGQLTPDAASPLLVVTEQEGMRRVHPNLKCLGVRILRGPSLDGDEPRFCIVEIAPPAPCLQARQVARTPVEMLNRRDEVRISRRAIDVELPATVLTASARPNKDRGADVIRELAFASRIATAEHKRHANLDRLSYIR